MGNPPWSSHATTGYASIPLLKRALSLFPVDGNNSIGSSKVSGRSD
ncbi:hypothetical protein ASZ90_016698 [hydrocarbon metagenome]|uniref:Uncharacterized protein n=1 Tax=hydrocarbon metagenome TaxID=938273 RepID=A0A0W8EHC6_9ZZZZ